MLLAPSCTRCVYVCGNVRIIEIARGEFGTYWILWKVRCYWKFELFVINRIPRIAPKYTERQSNLLYCRIIEFDEIIRLSTIKLQKPSKYSSETRLHMKHAWRLLISSIPRYSWVRNSSNRTHRRTWFTRRRLFPKFPLNYISRNVIEWGLVSMDTLWWSE